MISCISFYNNTFFIFIFVRSLFAFLQQVFLLLSKDISHRTFRPHTLNLNIVRFARPSICFEFQALKVTIRRIMNNDNNTSQSHHMYAEAPFFRTRAPSVMRDRRLWRRECNNNNNNKDHALIVCLLESFDRGSSFTHYYFFKELWPSPLFFTVVVISLLIIGTSTAVWRA